MIHILRKNYFEACSFAVYYAIKYNIKINNFNIDDVIQKNDAILSITSYCYCKKYSDSAGIKKLESHARSLKSANEMDEQWIFIYELLTDGLLDDDWKAMKAKKISFLKPEFI